MTIMPLRTLLLLVAGLGCLAACGGHPLAGNWRQDTGGDTPGMTLSFDADSDRIMVHTAPTGADGHHDHVDGTYTFAQDSGAVTVRAFLLGNDQPGTWTGTLAGERLELGAADTRLAFTKGGDPHGH